MYYVLASDFNTGKEIILFYFIFFLNNVWFGNYKFFLFCFYAEQNVSCGIIIHGISGTGKTYLAKAMINLTKLPVVYIYVINFYFHILNDLVLWDFIWSFIYF